MIGCLVTLDPKGCFLCQIFPFVDRTASFMDSENKKQYKIKDLINCSSIKVIYMLTCPCNKFYIGKTKRQLCVRIGENMREMKDKESEKPLAKHFQKVHRGSYEGLKIKGICALKLPPRRRDFDEVLLKEKWWIFKLGALIPQGLNTKLNCQVFLEIQGYKFTITFLGLSFISFTGSLSVDERTCPY